MIGGTAIIGGVASDIMDILPEDGEIVAVGLVVVYNEEDGETFARVGSNKTFKYEMLGLFREALNVVEHGDDGDE